MPSRPILQKRIGLFPWLLLLHAFQYKGKCYIVDHFLVGKEKILLQHVADASRSGSHILIFQIDLSFIRRDNTGKHIEQCGLSGTAGAYDAVVVRSGIVTFTFLSIGLLS